nr:copia protein [Tanacetum cinerariifolium]
MNILREIKVLSVTRLQIDKRNLRCTVVTILSIASANSHEYIGGCGGGLKMLEDSSTKLGFETQDHFHTSCRYIIDRLHYLLTHLYSESNEIGWAKMCEDGEKWCWKVMVEVVGCSRRGESGGKWREKGFWRLARSTVHCTMFQTWYWQRWRKRKMGRRDIQGEQDSNPGPHPTQPFITKRLTTRPEPNIPLRSNLGVLQIVVRNKARLVAQGHTQEERIEYDKVFAPVARIEDIRLFLAYASFMGFTVYQMDVKSAFLYGTIDEEVYVMQPPGFKDPSVPAKVYKVEKAMYGLHQAPRAWYDVRSSNTPTDKENPWGKDGTRKDVDLHLYRSMIGSLMYLTASRPDIMFAVCAWVPKKTITWNKICESNSHYGYECSQRVPLVYEPKPYYNQNFSNNDYPHDLPGVTLLIDHHCCYKCGDSLNDFFCHQCTCEFCGNGAHDGYNCPAQVPFIQTLPSFPQQYPCCEDCGGPNETFQCQPMDYFESNPCYDSNYSSFDQIEPPQYSVNPSLNIQNEPSDHEIFISKLIQQKLQNEYAQPFLPIAITFDLPTVEPKDSLRMGDEHLDTISETESDEFIKSSVKNLVPSPSESEDLSDSECDVPACDDFTTFSNLLFDADDDISSSDNESFFDEDISKEIYSNPLYDEEIISIKIDPHQFNAESDLIESLLNHDSSIISSFSKIDSILDEFVGELTLLKTIPPGINKIDCDPEEEIRLIEKLVYDNSSPRPPEGFISENSDAAVESFSPFPIPVEDSDSFMEEIDLSFTPDDPMPSGIEEDDYESERDMLIFEELLRNDSLSLPEDESFHFDISSFPRPPAKLPDDDLKILTIKVMGDIYE